MCGGRLRRRGHCARRGTRFQEHQFIPTHEPGKDLISDNRFPAQRQSESPSPLARLFTVWFPPEPKEGTVMTTDAQVRKLRQFLGEGHPLYRAALKVGMDAKSARKYRHADRLPSESFTPGTWRTREDPFQDVWPQLRDLLEINPGLQAKTLFGDLQRRFPGGDVGHVELMVHTMDF